MKSDSILKRDVIEELEWEPTLTSKDIKVEAIGGVVTLSGTVPTYAQKWSAERAAQRVGGVKAIAEDMTVKPVGAFERSDTEIAQAVVHSMKWNVLVPGDIQATVEDGWVVITGAVKWGFERTAAEDSIRFLIGVKGVTNSITLRPSVHPTLVKDAIERALKRNAEVDAESINVSANGGEVTLGGQVKSWNEREEATTAAWNAPGVTWVKNEIHVLP